MHKLNKAVKNLDLNAIDLANAICDIVVNNYGEHNYNDFINVVNSRLGKPILSGVSQQREPEVNHAYIEDADQIGSYDVTGRVDRLWITSKEFDSIKDIAN